MEFLDQKYEDVLLQLRLANERHMQQSRKLKELDSALESERKKNEEATATSKVWRSIFVENVWKYLEYL